MIRRNAFITLLFIFACVASWWIVHQSTNNYANLKKAPDNTPDFYMTDVNYISTNKQGKVNMRFTTPKLVHFKIQNRAQYISPKFELITKSNQKWFISSKKGTSKDGINILNLTGNVNIHQPAGPKNSPFTLTTSQMTFYPQKETMHTEKPVTMIQPGTRVNATGLNANLKTGEIKLLSRARGVYEPQ